ncbi:GroES-like protein [Panus rudis PR-1116 ss-1]|nr:GroES-like protein [Panus rudis PR-1116 ss-1]
MSQQFLPTTMKALVIQSNKMAKLEEVPIPQIEDHEILVKNVTLALNPTDWLNINGGKPGTILGADFAGIVVKVGANVTNVAIGDKVEGFVQGGSLKDEGAFGEYAKTDGELVWKIPDATLSFEEDVTMGCAFWTAAQALFHPTRLGLAEPPAKVDHEEWILIYGGSSSVGMFAVQLAHLAGYRVVSLASPRNFELVKTFGADAVFDYKDPDVVSKVKAATGDSIHRGFDTISKSSSQILSAKFFAPSPGKLIVILIPESTVKDIKPDLDLQLTLIYTVQGRSFDFFNTYFETSLEDKAHMVQFLKKVPGLVKEGKVRPNPVKLWPGTGLETIHEGMQYMKEGKISVEKVVHRL